MKDADTRILSSWKEIVQHLDVTVRTAQLWEKQRGLPVRRMPGRRSRVYLRIDEYEAWLMGQGNAAQGALAGESAARSRYRALGVSDLSTRRGAAVGVGISIAVIALAFSVLWLSQEPQPELPVRGYVSGDTLIVENGLGDALFRHRFEKGLSARVYARAHPPLWFADVDDDGIAEVLFSQRHAEPGLGDILFCFTAGGDELWRFEPGMEVSYQGETFENIYHTDSLQAADLGDGRRVVVISSIHYLDEPTQIAVLSAEDGTLMSQYWHSGHIGHETMSLRIADVLGDGRKEIYAAGISNARKQATLVILDPDAASAASEEPAEYQVLGFPTGKEMARVFFPRSAANRLSDEYNGVVGVFPNGDSIRVSVAESFLPAAKPTVQYKLTPALELVDIGLSDRFRFWHRQLTRDMEAMSISSDDELKFLWREGIEVVRSARLLVDRPDSGPAG